MSRNVIQFARHYLEMVIAMVVGMVALGVPAVALLGLFGVSSSDLTNDAPAVVLLGMGISMTVPMVAWMRYRGHGWRASNEMAASMLIPTFAAMLAHGAGIVEDINTVLVIEHVVMLPAMLAAMLLRPSEYLHHEHGLVAAEA